MIVKEVNKFMALMPLMLPKLIDSKQCVEPDIAEDSAVLYFNLEERFPIGMVMDMIDDDLDLLLLYHGTKKSEPRILHCCFFASPKLGKSMFKINLLTAADGFVDSVAVTSTTPWMSSPKNSTATSLPTRCPSTSSRP